MISKTFLLHRYRHSEEKNPGTPPNSPLTSVPSSSSFLLNEMLARPSATDAQEGEIEKEEVYINIGIENIHYYLSCGIPITAFLLSCTIFHLCQ